MAEPASAGVITALGGLGWKVCAGISCSACSICGGVNLRQRISPVEPAEVEDITRRYARNVKCINNGRYLGKQRIKLDGDSVVMPSVDPNLHLDSVKLENKFVSIDGSQIEITQRTPGLQQVTVEFRTLADAQEWVETLLTAQEEGIDEEDILNEKAALAEVEHSIEKHQTIINAMTKMVAWMEDQTPETRKAAKAKRLLRGNLAKAKSTPPKATPKKSADANKENKGARPTSVPPTSSATSSKGLAEKPSYLAPRGISQDTSFKAQSSTPSESSEGRTSYFQKLQERRAAESDSKAQTPVSRSPAPSDIFSGSSSPLAMKPRPASGSVATRGLTPPRTGSYAVSVASQSGAATPIPSGAVTPTRSLLSDRLQQRMQEKLGDKSEAAKPMTNGVEKKSYIIPNGKASLAIPEKTQAPLEKQYEPPWRRATTPTAPPAETSKAQPDSSPSPWQKLLDKKSGSDAANGSTNSPSKRTLTQPPKEDKPAPVLSRSASQPETPTAGSTFAKLTERTGRSATSEVTKTADAPVKRGLTPPPKDKEVEKESDARKRALTPPRLLKESQATCEFCGNHFMEDSLFCRHCGAKRPGTK